MAKNVLTCSISFFCFLVFELFLFFCLPYFAETLSITWRNVLFWTASATNLTLLIGWIVGYYLKKELWYKSCITGYVLLIFILAVLYILMRTGFGEVLRDHDKLKEYLKRSGVWMGALFILLQFLQVVVLPIPSFATVAAGSALFGPLRCFIYSFIGIMLGSIVAFIIGRFVGYKAVSWLVGENTLEKWLKKVKGKDKIVLSAMFVLPVFPDDVLCMVAGLSSMSFKFFLVVITFSRFIAILTTSYSVSLIPFNTWWGITLWALFFIGVTLLIVFLYKKSDELSEWLNKKSNKRRKSNR